MRARSLEHVPQKWEPMLRIRDMRKQEVRAGCVKADERDAPVTLVAPSVIALSMRTKGLRALSAELFGPGARQLRAENPV